MKIKLNYIIIRIIFLFFIINVTCKKPLFISFGKILKKYQWRKTKEAIYSINNDLEKYTFIFENVDDCKKNSFYEFGGITEVSGNGVKYNFCSDYGTSFSWKVKDDSIYIVPYDTTISSISRFIEYFDQRSYILRYDTTIDGSNKKIKETYSAFDL